MEHIASLDSGIIAVSQAASTDKAEIRILTDTGAEVFAKEFENNALVKHLIVHGPDLSIKDEHHSSSLSAAGFTAICESINKSAVSQLKITGHKITPEIGYSIATCLRFNSKIEQLVLWKD